MTSTYFAPGPATAYVADDVIAVVDDVGVDHELLRTCIEAPAWDVIVESAGGHADAAIVMRTEGGVRIAVAGAMSVEVADVAGTRRIEGAAAWTTRDVPRAHAVAIARIGDAEMVPTHCLDAGAVPVACVTRAFVPGGPTRIDAFDDLFGPTAERTVESAAVRDDEAVARPPSPPGVLVFSTGERVVVDRTIVVGRNPRRTVADEFGGVTPRWLRVTGPAVSRRHVVIRVDRWLATVEDLGSSNGTWVTRPGRARMPIRAGEPVELTPGVTVDLGGDVSFVVEEVA